MSIIEQQTVMKNLKVLTANLSSFQQKYILSDNTIWKIHEYNAYKNKMEKIYMHFSL